MLRSRALLALATVSVLCTTAAACSKDADEGAPSDTAEPTSSPSAPQVLASSEPEADAPAPSPGKDLGDDLIQVPRKERRIWVASATDFLEQVQKTLDAPDPEQPLANLEHVSGLALESLVNAVTEFDANGWRVEGRATIVSEQVVRRTDNPTSVVMRVCVDNSQIRVLDADGTEVPNSRAVSPRTLNVMALTEVDGRWVVTEQRPAPQPDC